jgi:hypothetical protein
MKTMSKLLMTIFTLLLIAGCGKPTEIKEVGGGVYTVIASSKISAFLAADDAHGTAQDYCLFIKMRSVRGVEVIKKDPELGNLHTMDFTCITYEGANDSDDEPLVLWDRVYGEVGNVRPQTSGTVHERRLADAAARNKIVRYRSATATPERSNCASDHDCRHGNWCKKMPFNVKGVCSSVVDEAGFNLSLAPRDESGRITNRFQCVFNDECPQGFICGDDYHVCQKGW